jgi:pimeloyl-ACP methyl ester carboxylesterase
MLCVAQSVTESSANQQYVLGGASMGCATALEAALQAPENVAGLILVLPPTAWNSRAKQARTYRRRAWMSGAFGATPYRMLNFLPSGEHDAKRRLALTTTRELSHANPLYVQAALQGAALSDLPRTGRLAKLTMPTIIFTWTSDSNYPVSTVDILADTLPNIHSVNISEADDTGDWSNKICEFLDEISRSSRSRSRSRSVA